MGIRITLFVVIVTEGCIKSLSSNGILLLYNLQQATFSRSLANETIVFLIVFYETAFLFLQASFALPVTTVY